MALSEEDIHRVVFVRSRDEGGINFLFEPESQRILYQVFIHSSLPLKTQTRWEFERFEEARSFAAKLFNQDWDMLAWDQKAKRPCETGEHECGSGSCETCKSTGGGCTTCGATD